MLTKHQKPSNPESTLFKSSSKDLPKINLLSVDLPKAIHSSFDMSQDLRKTHAIIDTLAC